MVTKIYLAVQNHFHIAFHDAANRLDLILQRLDFGHGIGLLNLSPEHRCHGPIQLPQLPLVCQATLICRHDLKGKCANERGEKETN